MRQVAGLLRVINKSHLVEFYDSILSYRLAVQKEIPSFEEFMQLTSKESGYGPKAFDEKTDKFLEELALKRLNEMRANHGK